MEGASDESEAEKFAVPAGPENLAYVIYTSGSTGNPKGVLIQHRSLSNYTQAAVESFGLKPEDRVLQFASISFDTAAEEIYPCLAAGATLVLRDERMLDTTEIFLEKILDYGITVLDLPTAYWHHLTLDLATKELTLPAEVRLLIIGGEEALAERLDQWRGLGCDGVQLVNSYGPTEATIVATTCCLTAPSKAGGTSTKASHIGSPVANVKTYVLDARLQLVPIGVPGELYIGGEGVARGYLNRPALTAERFIPDPFSTEPGRRLYRSGDLACYLPDGTIEYLGRADQQVKIRGYRVELGEVESVLCEYAAVREAVVVAREDVPGDKRLVAYVTSAVEARAVPAELRAHLRERLPEYMVPAAFVVLEELPLTPSGKLDRRALPVPEVVADASAYEPPRTPVEEVLCSIWAEVLGSPRVGVNDNFFDLGGHSLKLLQAHSKIRERLGPVVSLVDMFQYPTVSAMAAYLNRQGRDEPTTELRMQERAGKRRQVAVRYKQLRREQINGDE